MATSGIDLTQAAAAFVDAFNRADWEAFRDSIAPDAVYTETGTGRRVEGADAYVELCQGWKAAFPDVVGTIRTSMASGGAVAQEIVWEGTHTGALETPAGVIDASGNHISVPAATWIRYAGDRAQEIHHYLDVLTLLQQVQGVAASAA
jgi:steroid delta-isomerase-like uncharacterized protein